MESPKWMRGVLLAAAACNLGCAALVVLWPAWTLGVLGIVTDPVGRTFWQGLGMFVAAWGVGYACAALDPISHWPMALAGLFAKVCGAVGCAWAVWRGALPATLGWATLAYDALWWIPFFLILRAAYCRFVAEDGACELQQRGALASFQTNTGESLAALSRRGPTLAVFLRHFGCTFCREMLADLALARPRLEAAGVRVALVHNGDEFSGEATLRKYGLADLPRIADPNGALYRAMGLRRGTLRQLLSPFVLQRGFEAGVKAGHGVGGLQGDGFRMPGVFVLVDGRVVKEFRHASAADRPDYFEIAGCPLPAGRGADSI